jgi:sulfhydrogenase subunit beta (sulfur reductase)
MTDQWITFANLDRLLDRLRERWRQRIMHKFRYAVENHNHPFCVGCGRCIRNCPAGLDLRTVLKEVGA